MPLLCTQPPAARASPGMKALPTRKLHSTCASLCSLSLSLAHRTVPIRFVVIATPHPPTLAPWVHPPGCARATSPEEGSKKAPCGR